MDNILSTTNKDVMRELVASGLPKKRMFRFIDYITHEYPNVPIADIQQEFIDIGTAMITDNCTKIEKLFLAVTYNAVEIEGIFEEWANKKQECRMVELMKLIKSEAKYMMDELEVPVTILDVKNTWGVDKVLISPIHGRGQKWVALYSVRNIKGGE